MVCADIRISNGKLRNEFLNLFKDDVDLQKIFIRLFEDLDNTFEIGSLLKVRQPFENLLNERGSSKTRKQARFSVGQTEFGKKGLAGQTNILSYRNLTLKTMEKSYKRNYVRRQVLQNLEFQGT